VKELAEAIAPIVVRVLREEYEMQGHKLTGNLSQSISTEAEATATGAVLRVLMLEYGVYLSTGVSASRIPYSPGSGARSSKYITGLTEFAKKRFGVGQKEAVGIAFAIARKHKQEGMPTKASFAFSRNGRRTGAIDAAFQTALPEIQNQLAPIVSDAVFNLIKKWQ
jgi:hypothetical protein